MITKRQKLLITYYLSRSAFLGIGFSRIFDKTHQDSIISIIIGSILGLLIIQIFKFILNKKEGLSLKEYIDNSKLSPLIKTVLLLFSITFIIIILTILNSFISSFFLLNTPTYFVMILFLAIAFILVTRGIKNITKTGEVLFFPNFIIPIIIAIVLLKYIDITNIFPLLTSKTSNILFSSLSYCIYSTAPYIFLLNIKNNGKDIDKFYILNTISIFLIFIFTMLVLGKNLTDIYRFPEYIVLKRIKIFNFIEKIENIVSYIWITDEVLSISMALYTIYELINKNKKILISIIMAILFIESFVIANNFINSLFIYYNAIYILLISLFLILIPLLLIKKDESNPSWDIYSSCWILLIIIKYFYYRINNSF